MPKRIRERTRHKDTPAWAVAADLYDGEWMGISKLQLKTMTRPEVNDLKTRVLGVLLIHAFGFEAEIGVVMRLLKARQGEKFEANPALVRQYTANRDGSVPVTEVMTSDSVATKLVEYGLDAYAEAKVNPSDEQIAALKEDRREVRKVLNILEDEGRIARARLDCRAQELDGIGYVQAVTEQKLMPLRVLAEKDPKALKKLGGRRGGLVGIFVLARPNAPAVYGRNVGKSHLHSFEDNPSAFNERECADQLWLALATDYAVDPEVLKKHPELVREMERYTSMAQRTQQQEDARKRQELKMRGMVELIARDPGKTFQGKQKDLNFAKPASLPAKPDKTHSSVNGMNGHAQVSASLNPNGKEVHPVDTQDRHPLPPSPPEVTERPPLPTRRDAEKPLASQPRQRISEPEVAMLFDVMRKYCNPDEKAVNQLVMFCRDNAPRCTAAQIADAIHLKGPYVAKRAKSDRAFNAVGFLLTAVPRLFEGQGALTLDAKEQQRDIRGFAVGADELDMAKTFLAAAPGNIDPEDLEWARGVIRKLAQSQTAAPEQLREGSGD